MSLIVAVSDLHLDWKTRGYERAGDVLGQVRRAVEYANDHQAALFAVLGDVLEGHDPDARAWTLLGRLKRELDACRCPKIVVAGNHDVVDRVGCHSAVWPLADQNCVVAEEVEEYSFSGFTVLAVPHASRALALTNPQKYLETRAVAAIRDARAEYWWPIVALCHQEVEEARPGSEADMDAGERLVVPRVVRESPEVSVVLCGHIHEAQDVLRYPGAAERASETWDPMIHVVGSLERLTFGERGQPKSFLALEVP